MIKINTNNIKEWNFIKYCHNIYFETYVKPEKNNLIFSNNKYSYDIKKFIDDLFDDDKNLTELAIGEIGNLKKYVKLYNEFVANIINKIEKKDRVKAKEELDTILKKLFNYRRFRGNINNIIVNENKMSWNRHRLLSLMNIRTCPYCNRQYITNFEGSKTTADLDHFFTQDDYPLLALSLYNFIPSCQICNSRFKGSRFNAEKHIYPYNEEFGDECKFRIESSSLDYLWRDRNDFHIGLKNTSKINKEKIDNSMLTFKIREVYQSHNDYVIEIIKKAMIYNEDVIEDILVQYPDMFNNSQEIWQCIMGNYMQDNNLSNNRPLAKLTKDIAEEYGIKL